MIGSFLNVVIYRLPIMMQREWREQCEELQESPAPEIARRPIQSRRAAFALPVLRQGNQSLAEHPGAELFVARGAVRQLPGVDISSLSVGRIFTAAAAAVCAWHFGFGWEALMAIGLSCVLVTISLIDVDTQLIPDSIVLPLLWVGLAMSLFHPMAGADTLFIAPQGRHYRRSRGLSEPLDRLSAVQADYR